MQVADYSGEEKTRLLRRIHALFIAGLIGILTFAVIACAGLDSDPLFEAIGSFGLGAAAGMLVIGVVFTGRNAARIREFKRRLLRKAGRKNG